MPRTQEWQWCCDGQPVGVITLLSDHSVKWQSNVKRQEDAASCGRWDYKWSPAIGGWFIVEFSSRHASTWRKHVFEQVDDDLAKLLPVCHPAYTAATWFPYSKGHTNSQTADVTMTKIADPDVSSESQVSHPSGEQQKYAPWNPWQSEEERVCMANQL